MIHPKPFDYRTGTPEMNCANCVNATSITGMVIPTRPIMCQLVTPKRRVAAVMVCDRWQPSDPQQEIDLNPWHETLGCEVNVCNANSCTRIRMSTCALRKAYLKRVAELRLLRAQAKSKCLKDKYTQILKGMGV